MSLGSKIKKKLTGRMINKGMDEMGVAVAAFRDDVADIPEKGDKCGNCWECRNRAIKMQEAISKYFAVYLRPKGGP